MKKGTLLVIGLLIGIPAVVRAQTLSTENEGQGVTAAQRWLQEYYSKQAASYEFFHDEAHSL